MNLIAGFCLVYNHLGKVTMQTVLSMSSEGEAMHNKVWDCCFIGLVHDISSQLVTSLHYGKYPNTHRDQLKKS